MNNKAFKSGIWYVISNFLVKGLVFITTPIFTRFLTHAEYGEYSNYLAWLSNMIILATLNLEATFARAKHDYKNNFDQYVYSVLTLSTMTTLIWLVIINVFEPYVFSVTSVKTEYMNYMLLYLIFFTAVNIYQTKERVTFGYKKTVALGVIVAVTTTVMSVAMVMTCENRLDARVIGGIVPTIIIGSIVYIIIAYKGKKIDFSVWIYAIPIVLPYIPHLLSMTLLNSMDRTMITKYCGAEYTAIYGVAYTCAQIIQLLMTSVNSAFSPWLADRLMDKEYEKICSVSYIYVGVFSLGALGVILIAPEVLLIMGGESYLSAMYVIPPVALGCFYQFLYTLFVNVEQFRKKTIGMAFASMIAALTNFGLNMYFIPRYGYIAAAYTTMISYACLLAMHMYLVHRIGEAKTYNYKFILGIALGVSILSIGFNFIYGMTLLRYIVFILYILIIGILVWKKKMQIMELLQIKMRKVDNNKM